MSDVELKIAKINKFFKTNKLFLEIYLLNYETYNIYIRIDYIKKLDVFKLSWFNLEVINLNKIEKYMGSEYINSDTVREIISSLKNKNNNFHEESENNIVILNGYFDEGYHYRFSKFIPKDLSFLKDIFIMIFNLLPRKLDVFLYELNADIMETKSKFEYQDYFSFDLYNGDLNILFSEKIIESGNNYYKKNKVKFLEKIDDKYYAVVDGIQRYLIVIKYNEENKEMLIYSTCSCEFYCRHIYSVIKAIREKKENKFYKVIYINKKENLLENLTNSKYLMCSGTEDEYIEIINKYGELELVPLLDDKNKLNFKILEDSSDNNLSREIEKVIK